MRKRLRKCSIFASTLNMAKKVTIKDIASEMNIAYSTVSRALNNLPGVGEDMRRKILEKSREMGYEPNTIAQQLRKGHGNTIGLIVPRINRFFFSNVIHGVETIAKEKGFSVLISQSNELAEDEAAILRTFISNNVAGVIVSLSAQTTSSKPFKELQQKNIPLVMFDRTLKDLGVHRVVNDNYKGAYQAVTHLIEQGYSNILHFGGPQEISIYKERSEGYKKALTDHGMPVNPQLIFSDVLTREDGYNRVKELLKKGIPFDAIHASGDYSALGAKLSMEEEGFTTPEDFGVIGVANEPFTELLGMSSLEQFSEEVGRSAANLIFEEINRNNDKSVHREVVIPAKLITRTSSLRKRILHKSV